MPSEEVGLPIRHIVYERSPSRTSADEAGSCSGQTNQTTWFHLNKVLSSGRKP